MTDMREYKVSTITAVGSVSTTVDLALFYEHVGVGGIGGVAYAEYARAVGPHTTKGVAPLPKRPKKKKKKEAAEAALPGQSGDAEDGAVAKCARGRCTRPFDNQVTVVLSGGGPNMKVFRNGVVQMTGVRSVEQGHAAVERLVDAMRAIEAPGVFGDPAALRASAYRVCLINCDTNVGYELRRDKLFARMRASYATLCDFEPCVYPGVKLRYMWNADPPSAPDGVCPCGKDTPCSGNGDGNGRGSCRRVTIAVFQSGKVTVSGARSMQQVDDAYDFVTTIASKHADEIRLPGLPPKPHAPPPSPRPKPAPQAAPSPPAKSGHTPI